MAVGRHSPSTTSTFGPEHVTSPPSSGQLIEKDLPAATCTATSLPMHRPMQQAMQPEPAPKTQLQRKGSVLAGVAKTRQRLQEQYRETHPDVVVMRGWAWAWANAMASAASRTVVRRSMLLFWATLYA